MSKKYPITFREDYIQWEEWANEGESHFAEWLKEVPNELAQQKQWKNKELSLAEAEELIEEFGSIIFDGKSIQIINSPIYE